MVIQPENIETPAAAAHPQQEILARHPGAQVRFNLSAQPQVGLARPENGIQRVCPPAELNVLQENRLRAGKQPRGGRDGDQQETKCGLDAGVS